MAWWNNNKQDDTPPPEQEQEQTEETPAEGISRQEFEALNQKFDTLTTALLQNQSALQPVVQEPVEEPIPTVNDDDILAALEEGDHRKVLDLQRKQTTAEQERLRREHRRELETLRQQGLEMINQVNQQVTEQSGQLKYYKRFEKEINDRLKTLPVEQQAQFAVRKAVHDLVVGENQDQLLEEEIDRRARQRRQQEEAADMAEKTGRQQQEERRETTFGSVFGERFAQPNAQWDGGGHLWSGNHNNPDVWAGKLGYGNADDYAKFSERIMSVENCRDCFMPLTEALRGEEHNCRVRANLRRINV